MGTVLVVDGADVCRGPLVAFTLRRQFAGRSWLQQVDVVSRGVQVEGERRMCEVAAMKLGLASDAGAFADAHRSHALTAADLRAADLVITAERSHRAAIVRMSPAHEGRAFTWKEALVLAESAVDRIANGGVPRSSDLPGLVAQLTAARVRIGMIEPAVQTAAFHWQPTDEDPLTVADGHEEQHLHRHTVDESYAVAARLGLRFQELADPARQAARTGHPAGRGAFEH